ncbi:sorting nexin-16-like isoform X2 [Prorops nasuta]|uniref:sorting nexin-16-like isoform X2 n=1 Tax=Prorops nasuta TaxID=863751 RepID=UPI0034CECED8
MCSLIHSYVKGTGGGCVSEVTLAISKTRVSQTGVAKSTDSPDSDGSTHSNSFTLQSYTYPENGNNNPDGRLLPLSSHDLRIPIVGYEVMEERARFTVYKLRIELKTGDCWFVFRRYTDFLRLLTQLKRQKLPTSELNLPRKKWLGSNFSPSFLEERINGLQQFVNGILSNTILIGNTSVREFFCLDEPPTLSDTAEESRAIFEAMEDTIYHLRKQLRECENALASETTVSNELRLKLFELQSSRRACLKCGMVQDI